MTRYLAECLVTLEELVQRSQFLERLGRQRPAHMLVDKSSEPLAQSTSLIGNLVQLTRHCTCLQLIQCVRRHKFSLSQPPQKPVTAVEPVDRSIDRCSDGVQKIETERVGDKNC